MLGPPPQQGITHHRRGQDAPINLLNSLLAARELQPRGLRHLLKQALVPSISPKSSHSPRSPQGQAE